LRTIFINRFFYPDHSATSQILSDLAFDLSKGGMPVTVITSRLGYDGSGKSFTPHESIDGVDIRRVWTTRFGRSRLLLRFIDYLTFYGAAAWTLLRLAAKGDVVVAMTDPPMLSIIAAPIAKLRRAYLINWLQDLFPEVMEALCDGRKPGRFVFIGLRWLRDVSLRCADMNVAIGELMAERIRRAGVPRLRISVLPNWADCGSLRPVAKSDNPLRARWGLSEDFVIGYSGNLGRAHESETLLAAIEAIETDHARTGNASIRWLFIGGGHALERIQNETIKRGLKSVVIQPYQPRDLLSLSLSVSDVHIVTLKPPIEGLIVPSKFYGAAAVGRPILFIGAPDGEIARLVERHGCGIAIKHGDRAALINALAFLAENPQHAQKMGERARSACERYYSKAHATAAWAKILHTVSTNKTAGDMVQSPVHLSPD
jgi:glycosyltransferase involved in cell wall biosynthesis